VSRTPMVPLCLALVVAGAAPSAGAAELTTTRIYRNGNHGLRCSATNVSKKAMALVHMALIQGDGAEVGANDCEDLPASQTCETSSADIPGGAYCRITFKGSAKQMRANLSAYDLTTSSVVAIEPAR
jgi:hypothetical protein